MQFVGRNDAEVELHLVNKSQAVFHCLYFCYWQYIWRHEMHKTELSGSASTAIYFLQIFIKLQDFAQML